MEVHSRLLGCRNRFPFDDDEALGRKFGLMYGGKESVLQGMLAPRCDLSSCGVLYHSNGNGDKGKPWFLRVDGPHNGGIVNEPKTGILLPTADEHVVSMYHPDDLTLGLGVALIDHEQLMLNTYEDPSVLRVLFYTFPVRQAQVTIHRGIGPCCYRVRGRPFDIAGLIRKRLIELGVPKNNITVEGSCTGCPKFRHGTIDDGPQFHSRFLREQNKSSSENGRARGQNAFIAWFTT